MQREVIKWLQTLDLSTPVKNPNRDLANGVAAAEIVSRYAKATQLSMHSLTTGASAESRRHNWQLVATALRTMGCTTVDARLLDEVLRLQPNAGVAVLENMYEFLTQRQLPMRSLNTAEHVRPYITPKTAPRATDFLAATLGMSDDVGTAEADATKSTMRNALSSTGASPAGVRLPALNSAHTQTATQRALGLPHRSPPAEDDANGEEAAREAVQRVQTQLALTANHELATGHAAVTRQPRYAQPTANSLLRPANDDRQNVSLAKAKFSPDARHTKDRNEQILSEHNAVKGWKGQDAAYQTRKAARDDAKRLQMKTNDAGVVDRELLLTTLLRGPYSTARVGGAGRRREGRGRRGQSTSYGSQSFDTRSRPSGAGAGGGSARTSAHGRGGGDVGGSEPASQHVQKIQVNVLGAGLLQALERSGAMHSNRFVADERSVDLFRQCAFSVRKGISCLLHDVLAAQHELVPLVERCAQCGEGDVLEDLLLAVMCHRDELQTETLRACWASLQQNVVGIAAAICERPEEYHAILTALHFAFSLESAQVPLLHVTADTDDEGSEASSHDHSLHSGAEVPVAPSTEGHGRDALARAGTGHRRGFPQPLSASAPSPAVPTRHRSQSVGEALLAATRRNSLARARHMVGDTGDDHTVNTSFQPTQGGRVDSLAFAQTSGRDAVGVTRQRAVRLDRASLHLASTFVFLSDLGSAVHDRDPMLAETLLTEFFLPAAETALLPHGSTAMVEAVSRVLTAHLCGAADTLAASLTDSTSPANRNDQSKRPNGLDASLSRYTYAVSFLFDTLQPYLIGVRSVYSDSDLRASQRHCEAFHLYVYHTVRQLTSLVLDARALVEETAQDAAGRSEALSTASTEPETSPVVAFTMAVQNLTDSLFAQLQGTLATCLSQSGEVSRTVAVSLLAQLATLIEDAPATMAEVTAADGAKRSLLQWTRRWLVDPILQQGVVALFPSGLSASGWELKVVTLELLTLVHRKMFTWRVSLAERASQTSAAALAPLASTTYDLCLSPPRLERATVAVLKLFDRTPPLQRQLALTVVGRHLLPDTQPRLALQWLECLLGFSPTYFKACLLPYESRPRQMRRLTAAPRESVAPGREAHRATVMTLASSGPGALPIAATDKGFDVRTWGGEEGLPVDMSSIQMLLGRVEPEYVVAPLNQTWDTSSVVQTALRHMNRLSRDQVLAIVAAALLSPQPVEVQREQLAHNVAQLTSATTVTELSSHEDQTAEKIALDLYDEKKDKDTGDETAAWATTLRNLVGASRDHDDESAEDAAKTTSMTSAGNNTPVDPSDAAAMARHFWLATLQTLLPLIDETLCGAAEEEASSTGTEMAGETQQTAAAVLFTLFQRYADGAYVQGDMDGHTLLQRSMDWAATV